MSRPLMVDSSWYISLSRDGKDPLQALAIAAEERNIAVCGMIMAEVGRGIRDQRHLSKFKAAWSCMLYVPSTRRLWEQTLELAWEMDRKGIILPLQDLHIAVCTLSIGAGLLAKDQHFQQIPGLAVADTLI